MAILENLDVNYFGAIADDRLRVDLEKKLAESVVEKIITEDFVKDGREFASFRGLFSTTVPYDRDPTKVDILNAVLNENPTAKQKYRALVDPRSTRNYNIINSLAEALGFYGPYRVQEVGAPPAEFYSSDDD